MQKGKLQTRKEKMMKDKLVIVTDLGWLKTYRSGLTPKKAPRLELLEEVCWEEAHRHLDEWVTDMAGRRTGPTNRGWGAPITDDHNLKLENERRLIRRISKHIADLIQRAGQNGVWFAALEEVNHRIMDELPRAIRARIEKNLPSDLAPAYPTDVLKAFLESE